MSGVSMCYFNYLIGVSLMCSLPEQVVSRFLLHWKWSLKKAQQSNIAKGIRLKKKKKFKCPKVSMNMEVRGSYG